MGCVFPGGLYGGGHQQAAGSVRALRGGADPEAGAGQGGAAQMGAAPDQAGRGAGLSRRWGEHGAPP